MEIKISNVKWSYQMLCVYGWGTSSKGIKEDIEKQYWKGNWVSNSSVDSMIILWN